MAIALLLVMGEAAGAAWTVPQKLTSPGSTIDIKIKAASDGAAAILWGQPALADSSNTVLRSIVRSADGQWGVPEAIADTAPLDRSSATNNQVGFVVDEDGRVTVAWVREAAVRINELVVSSRVPGAGWTAPQILGSPLFRDAPAANGKAPSPAIAVTPDGTVAVAWSESSGKIAVATKPRDGGWSTQRWIAGPSSEAPWLSASADGRIDVVRDTSTLDTPRLAQADVVTRASDGQWLPLETVTGPQQNADTRIVGAAAGLNGSATVVWLHEDGAVKLQYRSRRPDRSWTALADLSPWMTRSLERHFQIAPSAAGTMHAVWQNGTKSFLGIPTAWIETASQDNASGAWSGRRQISSNHDRVLRPTIAVSSTGIPVAAWETAAWSGWPGTLNPVPWNTHPWSNATPSLAFVNSGAVLAVYARGCSPPTDPCDHGVEVTSTGGPEPPPPPPPPPVRPTRMVAFGDSYSSGQGLLPEAGLRYDCGTDLQEKMYYQDTTVGIGGFWNASACDTRTLSTQQPADYRDRPPRKYYNLCHRSPRAYPNQLRSAFGILPANYMFVACNGATTQHVGLLDDPPPRPQHPQSPVNVHGGKTQIDTVVPGFTSNGAPDLVTIGIGGNDAGFKGIIERCLYKPSCLDDTSWANGVIATINGRVFERLRDTLLSLKNTLRTASTPTVLAFGYPEIVGDPEQPCGATAVLGTLYSLSREELEWFHSVVQPAMNAAIRDAAAEAGVVYVDITKATLGRELCSDSSDRWINGIVNLGYPEPASFHPNQRGHDAIARYFIANYTDGAGHLLVSNPAPALRPRPAGAPQIYLGAVAASAVRQCGADCLEATACVEACVLHVTGSGFAPQSTLTATLHSEPVQLGGTQADSEGDVATDFQIPEGTPPGVHFLTLTGTSADGLAQYGTALIRIEPRGAPPPNTNTLQTGTGSINTASGILTTAPFDSIGAPVPSGQVGPRRLTSRITARWRVRRNATQVLSLVLHQVPARARVVVSCRAAPRAGARNRTCGVSRRYFYPATFKARLSLTRFFGMQRFLRPGSRITVAVTSRGLLGRRFLYTTRRSRTPNLVERCMPAGATSGTVRC